MHKKDSNEIWVRIYGDCDKQDRPNISDDKKGQIVRTGKVKWAFDNVSIPNWRKVHILIKRDCRRHGGSLT